jgi:putative flippase GtrA
MPEQTFRYAVCGGSNTVLSIAVFNIFNFLIFREQNVNAFVTVLKSHNAALFVSFCVSFVAGFLLMKYVVFIDSNLKGRIQLFRYLLSYITNLILSYFLLKLFVELLHINATIAQLMVTVIVIAISYLSQKHFTFKVKQ